MDSSVQDAGMDSQDWLVTGEGQCSPLSLEDMELPDRPYRLYRFLSELEDLLEAETDELRLIQAIAPRVRKLLTSSYWLQLEYPTPRSDPGWAVRFLYEEKDYPITVQMVSWLPGRPSPVHNHAAWGIVAIIGGCEKNQFWRRSPTSESPHRIEPTGSKLMMPGDIISFTSEAIHSIEPLGEEPAVTFNLYGATDFKRRFEFDPATETAKNF
jgi:predicted metal-dependent enzyme (double-stranded beta helix superfamily)